MPRYTPDCHLESSLDRVLRRKSTASPKHGSATCHFLPFIRWNGVSPSCSSWLNSVWRIPACSTIQASTADEGSRVIPFSSKLDFRVLTNPCTVCTDLSASPLLWPWWSPLGDSSGTISPEKPLRTAWERALIETSWSFFRISFLYPRKARSLSTARSG